MSLQHLPLFLRPDNKELTVSHNQPRSDQTHLVNPPLDDQPASARRHELLKHPLKIARDLLECALDRLVLPLVEDLDELLNRCGGRIKLSAPREELITLFREVGVLLESFFIHMREFFEPFVGVVQFLDELGA